MLNFLENSKRYLREFVEIGFLAVLAIILVYLILGPGSGAFVTRRCGQCREIRHRDHRARLIGIAIIVAMVYLIAPRWR